MDGRLDKQGNLLVPSVDPVGKWLLRVNAVTSNKWLIVATLAIGVFTESWLFDDEDKVI